MPIAPSFDDLEILGKAELIINRPDLQAAEGDITEMLIKAAAAMADRCIEYSASSFRDTFVDGASGQALTDLANDHWAIQRNTAVAATGSVDFTRVAATGPAGTIPSGTVVATAISSDGTRFTYTTDINLPFALNETGAKSVPVTAQELGPGSNAAIGQVNVVASTLFEAFTVTNPGLLVGGTDAETDAELRVRIQEFPSSLRRGTLPALEAGAKTVAGVSLASAFEDAQGFVSVYVADVAGNANTQMINDVQDELDTNWKCAGTILSVLVGTPLSTDVDYSITVRPGTDVFALETLIQAAIEGTMNKLKMGDTLSVSSLNTAITNVDIDNITVVSVNLPAADIAPFNNQVIKPGTITRS